MKKTVYLVEDDEGIIEVYRAAFERAKGVNVEIMQWGNEAIEKIKQIKQKKAEKPSLFIIDLILPDINGMEILKELKVNSETKDIPVFILSNYASQEIMKEGETKADKFILKTSIMPTDLVKMVEEYIK